tara:strand:+ start:347 stop:1147 length:801 start_codon:yes stop_codon:yes gene_type:complete
MTFILQFYLLFSAASLDLYITGIAWIISSAIIYKFFKKRFVATALSFLFLLPFSAAEWNTRIDNLAHKARNKRLSALNSAGIYNLNLIMATSGAALGYKEVAYETLLLGIPNKGKEVTMSSNFPMESKKIKTAVKQHIKSGRKSTTKRISWKKSEYFSDSSKVSLALDSYAKLKIKTLTNSKGKKYYDCTVRVFVAYPSKSITDLKVFGNDNLRIRMDEGIFGGLQKNGLFETYHMNWNWKVDEENAGNNIGIFWFNDVLDMIIKI